MLILHVVLLLLLLWSFPLYKLCRFIAEELVFTLYLLNQIVIVYHSVVDSF